MLTTEDGKPSHDYMILFDKGKPDTSFSTALLELGEWQDYGSKLYRINTLDDSVVSIELISSELNIDKKEFLVSPASVSFYFPHM
ncbi:hypothetical protein [Enterococcus sp. LJL51]|uniref:hypothetical protein n=1 Tax=Enterococcus sp. LJL51 TaxID=3416656 RepID=UPI003CE6E6E5